MTVQGIQQISQSQPGPQGISMQGLVLPGFLMLRGLDSRRGVLALVGVLWEHIFVWRVGWFWVGGVGWLWWAWWVGLLFWRFGGWAVCRNPARCTC